MMKHRRYGNNRLATFAKKPSICFLGAEVLIVCLGLSDLSAYAAEFSLDGKMEIIPNRQNIAPFSCEMTVHYRDCCWRIIQTWNNQTNSLINDFGDDGTYLYRLDHIDLPTGEGALSNSWVGQIHRSGFPRWTYGPEVTILFYAYVSKCYLDSLTNEFIDPVKFLPHDLKTGEQRVKSELTRNKDALGLPRHIVFFDSDNQTNAILTVEDTVRLTDFDLPSNLTLVRFDAASHSPLIKYRFHVRNTRYKCDLTNFKPNVTQPTLISDYRFSHGKAFVPPVVHGVLTDWPTETAAQSKPGFKVTGMDWEQVQADTLSRKGKPSVVRVFVIRSALALIAIAGIVGLWLITKQKQDRTTTGKETNEK